MRKTCTTPPRLFSWVFGRKTRSPSRPSSVVSVDRGAHTAEVCDWHANQQEGRQWAAERGYRVGLTICPACKIAGTADREEVE